MKVNMATKSSKKKTFNPAIIAIASIVSVAAVTYADYTAGDYYAWNEYGNPLAYGVIAVSLTSTALALGLLIIDKRAWAKVLAAVSIIVTLFAVGWCLWLLMAQHINVMG